ncbi:phosphatidic acid phosphatase type 2/haloperoxidase [Phlyctochytrium arcticum]|nr:phosphatidic acid phosphatase type 2/haloperoxidase [Phlyctochytrium arcticum]
MNSARAAPMASRPLRIHTLYEVRTNNLPRLLRECLWEWVAVLILAIAGACLELVQPFERVGFATDISIAYPHKNETIPAWLLGVLAIALPIVVILGVSLGYKRSVFDAHMCLLGLCSALALTLLFTQIVKITVGGLRPDFLARCQPILVQNNSLGLIESCTGSPAEVKEGRKSFFSGHSSLSWCGLGFLALYLSRHLNFRRAPLGPKYIITILPIIAAFLIAISRVCDYWHRWQDVVVGAIVGSLIAIYSYRYNCGSTEEPDPAYSGGLAETDRLATGVSRRDSQTPSASDSSLHPRDISHPGHRQAPPKPDAVVPIDDNSHGRHSRDMWIPMNNGLPQIRQGNYDSYQ